MKKIAIGAAVAFTVILAGLYIYAFTLPQTWTVVEERKISASPAAVYAEVSDVATWNDWSSWSDRVDPSATFGVSEKSQGEGAELEWRGEKLGEGRLEIVRTVPGEKVEYRLWFAGREEPTEGTITMVESGGGTKVKWVDRGSVEGNPLLRLLIGSVQEQLSEDISRSLVELDRQL